MRERTLDISEDLMAEAGWKNVEDIKKGLLAGDHGFYEIVEDAVPADAVISIEGDPLPFELARRYRVLSDSFTDEDRAWLTPVGRWKDEAMVGGMRRRFYATS